MYLGMEIPVYDDFKVFVILLQCFVLTTGYYDGNWRGKYGQSRNEPWKYNEWKTSHKLDDKGCCEQSCMIGPYCDESVAEYSPQFKSGYTFAEITEDWRGQKVRYNSTTYPMQNGCHCGNIVYSLLSVKNEMETDGGNDRDTFFIDPMNGEIQVTKELSPTEMYLLIVEARNKITNISSETKLLVARKVTPKDVMSEYSPIKQNGYEELIHHRQKRSITGNDITFTLTKLTDINETKVGSKVSFQLDIEFPGSSTMDMLVELFAPDNDSTVMILCDISVNINGLTPDFTPPDNIVLDSKLGNNITHPDRVIINFGNVQNTGANADTITILYSAVMVENPSTTNGNRYWISAGAEFDSENYLWVGQAPVTADYDLTTTYQPQFFVNAPSTVEQGSSHIIEVDMQLPNPHSTYNFKVYTPADSPGTMSVCSMQYLNQGSNFGCGNDFSSITAVLTTDPVGPGNYIGAMSLGQLLNMGSRLTDPMTADSNVSLSFVTHVYPTVSAGSLASLALSLEIDTNTLWVGNLSMTVVAKTASRVDPVISTVTPNFQGSGATVGEPFSITYDLTVPSPLQTGAGSHYVFEVLAPFTTEAIFSVCNLEIISVGRDLPCIKIEDLVPVFTSRGAAGSLPDTVTLDIGEVTNMGIYNQVGDNTIQVKATLNPIEGKAVSASSYQVYFGVTVDSLSIVVRNESILVQNPSTSIAVTNDTAPSFNMDFWDSQTDVRVNGVTRIDLDMLTTMNTTYPVMELEFLMPTDTSSTFFHVCKVEVESKGRNLPCLTPEWSNQIVEYLSSFGTEHFDRAKLDLLRLCNTGEYSDSADDNRAIFSLYLKVLNLDSLADGTNKLVSAGLMYSTTKLWIGQLQLTTRTSAGLSIPAPTGYIHRHFQRNSTAGDIMIGESAQYSLLLKIPPGEYMDLKIQATSSGEGLDVCMVRVFTAGNNLPCVTDDLTTKTYTYHSNNGRSSVLLDIGVIKKFDNQSIFVNNFFDDDSIIVEVITTGTQNGSYSFDLEVFVDTSQNSANSIKFLNQSVTVASSTYTQAYTDVVNVTVSIGEFIQNDNVSSDFAIGEVKRMLMSAVIPESKAYKLDFAVVIPQSFIGKLDILDAAIYSVGDNLPCIDTEKTTPQLLSTSGVYTDTAQFDLGLTCSWPIKPGDQDANTIIFEVFVRAMPNGLVIAGESVQVTGSWSVNDGSEISVTGVALNIVDTDSFVDKIESVDVITNDTVIDLDQPANIVMTIGENLTVTVYVTVSPKSQSRFLFDAQMPLDDSACLTIRDMRVIGPAGRNVLFMGPSLSKGLSFTPVYNSTLGNGQLDYGLIDLGIITNTGLSYRLKSNQTDDDKFKIEVDIQMADCGDSAHGKTHIISFGEKITNVVFIYDHPVQVNRNGSELPDIVFTTIHTVISGNILYIDGIVYHTNMSTAEGKNTSMFVYLPAYQIAPTSLASNNLSKCSVNSVYTDVLEIYCPSFYFSDILLFRASVSVNSSVELPQGFSAADSTALCEVGTDFTIRSDYYNLTDWYPYYKSSSHYIEYSVSAGIGGCGSALGMASGVIQDCQITGSTNSITSPTLGRLNGASAWRPYVRDGAIARSRYIQVYFGNTVKVHQVAVQQSGVYRVTSILVSHSHDGVAWYGLEEISLGTSPTTLETVLIPGAQEAEYIRIYLGNTTSTAKPDVSLRFELYGCTISGTMTSTDICNSAPSTPSLSDLYYRSFLVGNSNKIFVCDRLPGLDLVSRCYSSTDGDTWTNLDENLATLIGMDTSENYIFGYGENYETVLRSEDDGVIWLAVESSELTKHKSGGSWKNAINVHETTDSSLIQATPSLLYTQSTWGATYDGLFLSGQQRLSWTST